MYHYLKAIILSTCLFGSICTGVSWGESDDTLVNRWRHEHRQQIIKLIRGYVCGDREDSLHTAVKEIIRLESLLGTCSKNKNDFFIAKVTTDDLAKIPGQALMIYLENEGLNMDARCFFEGKRIKYFVNNEQED